MINSLIISLTNSRKLFLGLIIFISEIFKLALALSLCFLAEILKEPWLGKMRLEFFLILILIGVVLMAIEIYNLRKSHNILRKLISFLLIFSIASGSAIAANNTSTFYLAKQEVLAEKNRENIKQLGEHFIVGYWDFDEVKTLVETQAIGGIFITKRNVYNKSAAEIRQEIAALQAIRRAQKLSPLWIATDQEGGSISRLSPPLSEFPTLAKIINNEKNIDNKRAAIREYATKKGKELADIGVNLNFAPVVDLNKGIVSAEDKYSRIFDRAISADKEVVTKVALWYCDALAKLNVRCTLKHFPGLGRVKTDTHLAEAKLNTSLTELNADDLLPFRTIMNLTDAFVMLSHVKLTAIDEQNPVSFSYRVVKNFIRNNWNYRGILITDDFCMQAVFGSKDGIKIATVKAINAGVDLILISHDPTQYYPAMQALLIADKKGNVNREILQASKARLEENKKLLLAK